MTTTTTFNLSTIKDVLTWAHDDMHNTRAISKGDFDEHGATSQDFDQWTEYVRRLREAVKKYNAIAQDMGKTDRQISKALGDVWAEWRNVLKAGTEEAFDKNFFVRKNDAHLLAEWAGLHAQATAKGRVWTTYGETDFRKRVETAIGIRMAGNAMLGDDDSTILATYDKAVASKENTTLRLDGDGKENKGLRAEVKALTAAYEKMQAKVAEWVAAGMPDDAAAEILGGYKAKLDEAKKSKEQAETTLNNAEKTIKENQEKYDKIIALINTVGDVM